MIEATRIDRNCSAAIAVTKAASIYAGGELVLSGTKTFNFPSSGKVTVNAGSHKDHTVEAFIGTRFSRTGALAVSKSSLARLGRFLQRLPGKITLLAAVRERLPHGALWPLSQRAPLAQWRSLAGFKELSHALAASSKSSSHGSCRSKRAPSRTASLWSAFLQRAAAFPTFSLLLLFKEFLLSRTGALGRCTLLKTALFLAVKELLLSHGALARQRALSRTALFGRFQERFFSTRRLMAAKERPARRIMAGLSKMLSSHGAPYGRQRAPSHGGALWPLSKSGFSCTALFCVLLPNCLANCITNYIANYITNYIPNCLANCPAN
ncbi:hypothetical protein CYMTET_47970 [Cymbomonas tetramitiformis]|uniref:Uncharacterized protein n=1 Tax=Cymbomonas tetramitiformis TaxID=36881 RepID=A0AAE0BT64_9CHLO|nr:hypothetical protein CYMTET_47970 [Cymbomonas tetramitiformis]